MGTLTIFILVMMAIIIIPSLRPPKNKLLENMDKLKYEETYDEHMEAMEKEYGEPNERDIK